MLRKEIIKNIGAYSFIDKVEQKGIMIFMYYTIEGEEKRKRVLLRSTIKQLQQKLLEIKKEVRGNKYGRTKVGNYYIIWC